MDYLTKIKPYINHRPFKCSFGIYVFDTKYQIDHIGPQPVQLRLLYNQYNFIFSSSSSSSPSSFTKLYPCCPDKSLSIRIVKFLFIL